jgi:hypothetical protein
MRIAFDTRHLVVLTMLASLATACKEDEGEMGELITREVIGPMGGSISGSGLTLDVPAGALTADTEIELRTSMTNLSARDFVQDGAAVDIGPDEMRLRLPAQLTFDRGPDEPAVLFEQDNLTIASVGSSAWVNELGTVAIATAGIVTAEVLEPSLGGSPSSAGTAFRDLAHFRVALTETPTFNVAMTLYDTEQVYDKPLNGNGEGDCGFELASVQGGSLSSGCSEGQVSARVRVTSAEIQYDVAPYLSGKLDTPVVVGVVGGSDELAFQLGFFSFDTSPCYSETCSGYGTCEVQGENASCLCNEGYAPGEELTCVCVPDCSGRECGDNGCGEQCGPGCGEGEMCDGEAGQCVPNGDPTDTDPTDTTDTDPTDTTDTDATDTDPTDATTTDPTDATSDGGSSDGGSSGTTT